MLLPMREADATPLVQSNRFGPEPTRAERGQGDGSRADVCGDRYGDGGTVERISMQIKIGEPVTNFPLPDPERKRGRTLSPVRLAVYKLEAGESIEMATEIPEDFTKFKRLVQATSAELGRRLKRQYATRKTGLNSMRVWRLSDSPPSS